MRNAVAALIALAATAAAAEPAKVADLSWMEGLWTVSADGQTVREAWLPAAGGQMVGMSQTDRPGKRAFYEFMRIEAGADGKIAFTAVLEGQPPTSFTLVKGDATEAVFENLTHDFPQRVIYRRCGADLCARIEGTIGGKPQGEDWRYTRATWAR